MTATGMDSPALPQKEHSPTPSRPMNVPALAITPQKTPLQKLAEKRATAQAGPSAIMPASMHATAAADPIIPAELRKQLDALSMVQRAAVVAYLGELGKSKKVAASKSRFVSAHDAEELAAKALAAQAAMAESSRQSCWHQLAGAVQLCLAPSTPPAAAVPALPAARTSSSSTAAVEAPILFDRSKSATHIQSVWRGKSQRLSNGRFSESSAVSEVSTPVLPPAVQAAFDADAARYSSQVEMPAATKLVKKPSNLSLPGVPLPSLPGIPSFRTSSMPGMPSSIKPAAQLVPAAAVAPLAMPGMPGSIAAAPQLKY